MIALVRRSARLAAPAVAAALAFFPASPLAAQAAGSGGAAPADGAVATARIFWRQMADYIVQVAEELPEDKYAFKPTPDVRSMGQLIGHVAGAQYMICAAALGDAPRGEDDIEKSKTSKADLVAAIKASNEYCERAYRMTDADARRPVSLFGRQMTALGVLMLNATHDAEHYGNLVTYLRLNGIVPPSSRRS